jgi:hypothetical protein
MFYVSFLAFRYKSRHAIWQIAIVFYFYKCVEIAFNLISKVAFFFKCGDIRFYVAVSKLGRGVSVLELDRAPVLAAAIMENVSDNVIVGCWIVLGKASVLQGPK